jgi:hypothetical protein
MMIKAKANGNVIHADDEAAKQLIEAGIYEKYDEKAEKRAPVAPLTTEDFPKRRKPKK